ncbi:hypothetical protein JDBV14_00640 [Mycobacterium phage harman]|nr:hypothetical protein JDBV14_00640 [Mycobacterium phage harman]
MTRDEIDAVALRMAARYQRLEEYARLSTVLISVLPLIYGALTIAYGQELWAYSPIYRTALTVPYAPQSWGLVFITLGTLSLLFAWRRYHRAMSVVSILLALALSMFMLTFAAEAVASGNLSAVPPAVIYGLFSLAFLNRSRLAWEEFVDETGWMWSRSRMNLLSRWRSRRPHG